MMMMIEARSLSRCPYIINLSAFNHLCSHKTHRMTRSRLCNEGMVEAEISLEAANEIMCKKKRPHTAIAEIEKGVKESWRVLSLHSIT